MTLNKTEINREQKTEEYLFHCAPFFIKFEIVLDKLKL